MSTVSKSSLARALVVVSRLLGIGVALQIGACSPSDWPLHVSRSCGRCPPPKELPTCASIVEGDMPSPVDTAEIADHPSKYVHERVTVRFVPFVHYPGGKPGERLATRGCDDVESCDATCLPGIGLFGRLVMPIRCARRADGIACCNVDTAQKLLAVDGIVTPLDEETRAKLTHGSVYFCDQRIPVEDLYQLEGARLCRIGPSPDVEDLPCAEYRPVERGRVHGPCDSLEINPLLGK